MATLYIVHRLVLISSGRLCKNSTFVKQPSHPLREITNLALVVCARGSLKCLDFLQGTHRNSTNYVQDEARTSKRLLDRQIP